MSRASQPSARGKPITAFSRPCLVQLLDERIILCRPVGKYRRVRFDDLMVLKQKGDEASAKILDQLMKSGLLRENSR
jgi:hypothetical protein